jgi:hypothetical protein
MSDAAQPLHIAPVIKGTGGIPSDMLGYKKRNLFHRKQTFNTPVGTTQPFTPNADINGQTGEINLSNLGLQSPFIFVPHSYSLIMQCGANANINSFALVLQDINKSPVETVWGNSNNLVTSGSQNGLFAADIPMPSFQFDDFVNLDPATMYLRFLQFGVQMVVTVTSAATQMIVYQNLIYDIVELQ